MPPVWRPRVGCPVSDEYRAVMVGGNAHGRTYNLQATPNGNPPPTFRVMAEVPRHEDPTCPWEGVRLVDETYRLLGSLDYSRLVYVHESWVRCPNPLHRLHRTPGPGPGDECVRCDGFGWVAP